MSSIYEISNWAGNTYYRKDSIVKFGVYYYYAIQAHTSHASSFTADTSKWGGTALDSEGVTKPEFIWKPSYETEKGLTPKVKVIQFGDGYEQRVPDGINNNLLTLNLTFAGKALDEATAILHFFYAREGTESFLFTPPAPYHYKKKFIAKDWKDSATFYNNYNIRVVFDEKVE